MREAFPVKDEKDAIRVNQKALIGDSHDWRRIPMFHLKIGPLFTQITSSNSEKRCCSGYDFFYTPFLTAP